MKRSLSFILMIITVVTLLTSCGDAKSEKPDQSSASESSTGVTTDHIIWETEASYADATASDSSSGRFVDDGNGQFQVLPSEQVEVDTAKLNIAGSYNVLTPVAMQNGAAESGVESDFVTFFTDEIVLKILAGDSDIDIYLLNASSIRSLVERGIYLPIESDIVREFNDGCFGYLSEVAADEKGQTVAMPLVSSAAFVAYPIQAADELGFDEADIAYYDDFHSLVNNYNGERKAYAMGDTLMSLYGLQYEEYYCDFASKKFDYDTELYKNIYSLYGGWRRTGQAPVMTGFTHPSALGTSYSRLALDNGKTLFTTVSSYENFISASTPDSFVKVDFDINGWRAVHIPRISEEVDADYVNVTFAFINPYSEKYDEAVKLLEYIAKNYFDSISSYTFIRADKNEYPDTYMKDTQIFSDVYGICKNGFVSDYQLLSARNDVDDFQNERSTLDEAIEAYSREVNMWLNE